MSTEHDYTPGNLVEEKTEYLKDHRNIPGWCRYPMLIVCVQMPLGLSNCKPEQSTTPMAYPVWTSPHILQRQWRMGFSYSWYVSTLQHVQIESSNGFVQVENCRLLLNLSSRSILLTCTSVDTCTCKLLERFEFYVLEFRYERIYPVLNGTVKASGNVYVNPGAPAYVVQVQHRRCGMWHFLQATGGVFTDTEYVNPQPVWSADRNDYWGYGKMTTNQTHLHYEFMWEETYAVTDEFWIIKTDWTLVFTACTQQIK